MATRPPERNLRAFGLSMKPSKFADGLRLISLGLDALGHKGGAVTASANAISDRLEALKALLRR